MIIIQGNLLPLRALGQMTHQLHKVQVSILDSLRHTETARFSTLMRPTGLQSDSFKFYLRKLVVAGYVEKIENGHYRLTAKGKEFANNLNEAQLTIQRQPKLSLLIIVQKQHEYNEPLYLFQQRRRNPFFGFWGYISGPMQWDEDVEETATRELKKQTGLKATCKIQALYRQRDHETDKDLLLEDKLFVIMQATGVSGQLTNTWHGGHNQWMSMHELKKQPKYFTAVDHAVGILKTGQVYTSQRTIYKPGEY